MTFGWMHGDDEGSHQCQPPCHDGAGSVKRLDGGACRRVKGNPILLVRFFLGHTKTKELLWPSSHLCFRDRGVLRRSRLAAADGPQMMHSLSFCRAVCSYLTRSKEYFACNHLGSYMTSGPLSGKLDRLPRVGSLLAQRQPRETSEKNADVLAKSQHATPSERNPHESNAREAPPD